MILTEPLERTDNGSIRDDPYRTSRKRSSELMDLSSIDTFSLVHTGSIRNDSYRTSRKNSLELIGLSYIVSLG